MQELGKQNPELLQMINSNQEEFLRMINEPAPQGQPDMAELAAQLGAAGGGAGIPCSSLLRQHAETMQNTFGVYMGRVFTVLTKATEGTMAKSDSCLKIDLRYLDI